MDINAAEVKNYRCRLGWTQQILADSCDLSLRTIQRVERYGTASRETLMSLCAVFEIEQEVLIVQENSSTELSTRGKSSINTIILAVISGILVGAVMMYSIMR